MQLSLAGNMGEARANESVAAVREIVASTPIPAGIHVYVTGTTALTADQHNVGDKSLKIVTAITMLVILVSLFLVYRSVTTVILVLAMVILEISAARGFVAALGHYNVIGLSTFSVNLLTMLGIAAGTDYAIFVLGRYHGRAVRRGPDHGVLHHVPQHRARHPRIRPYDRWGDILLALHPIALFSDARSPLAIGIMVAVLASLTMAPAALVVGSRFGLLNRNGLRGPVVGDGSVRPWSGGRDRSWRRRSHWR